MTDTETTETAGSKAPSLIAYHVREAKGKRYYTRIGVAWPHKKGGGINIQLHVTPLDGQVVLFPVSEKKD